MYKANINLIKMIIKSNIQGVINVKDGLAMHFRLNWTNLNKN